VDATGQSPEAIAATRARELLEYSSDSVESELDRAQGWLQEAQVGRRAGYWQEEGMAGAVGALANAWGRLTLWSRANGAYDGLCDEMAAIMDRLVDVRRSVAHGPSTQDAEALQELLERVRHVREQVAAHDVAGG